MTVRPAFLTVADVERIHDELIDLFGGTAGIRDHGLLESAVAMPAARFAGQYLHDGLPAMAAALMFHLCQGHPFVDGNKRTALAAAEVFLSVNRARLAASNDELETLTFGVAGGRIGKDELVTFFRERVQPR